MFQEFTCIIVVALFTAQLVGYIYLETVYDCILTSPSSFRSDGQ